MYSGQKQKLCLPFQITLNVACVREVNKSHCWIGNYLTLCQQFYFIGFGYLRYAEADCMLSMSGTSDLHGFTAFRCLKSSFINAHWAKLDVNQCLNRDYSNTPKFNDCVFFVHSPTILPARVDPGNPPSSIVFGIHPFSFHFLLISLNFHSAF